MHALIGKTKGTSEIEISIDLGDDADSLTISGRGTSDPIRLGTRGVNLNGDNDADVTTAGIETWAVRGNGGHDHISAGGALGTGSAFGLSLTLFGGPVNDTLIGGANSDTLHGGAGRDALTAGAGTDTLYGNAGSDSLNGSAGVDTLFGGPGNDAARHRREQRHDLRGIGHERRDLRPPGLRHDHREQHGRRDGLRRQPQRRGDVRRRRRPHHGHEQRRRERPRLRGEQQQRPHRDQRRRHDHDQRQLQSEGHGGNFDGAGSAGGHDAGDTITNNNTASGTDLYGGNYNSIVTAHGRDGAGRITDAGGSSIVHGGNFGPGSGADRGDTINAGGGNDTINGGDSIDIQDGAPGDTPVGDNHGPGSEGSDTILFDAGDTVVQGNG